MAHDLSRVELKLVETLDDAMELKRWMGQSRVVLGLDTETHGLDWWRDPIRLVQIGDANTGWAIPFPDWKGLVQEILKDYDRPIALHNMKFDLHALRHAGVTPKRRLLHNTRPLAHVLDSGAPTGLKSLAARHIHPGVLAGEQRLKQGMSGGKWSWGTVPIGFGPYWQYGALDPVLTARLFEELHPKVVAMGCEHLYEMEVACELVLMDAEERGVRLNHEYIDRRIPELERYLEQQREWIELEFGIRNPGSAPQVITVLHSHGLSWEKRTKNGNVACDEEVLAAIDHPVAKAVLDYRNAEKLRGTYLSNFRDFADGEVLHASINPLGARTGRMSVSRPSLQNVPAAADPRDAFMARDGNKMVLIDYDQVELRLLAHFAAEPDMIQAIHDGVDLHTRTAQLVYGLGDDKPTKAQRDTAKGGNFATIYGSGTATFAGQVGISFGEAQAFRDRYAATYPRVKAFMREVESTALSRARTDGSAWVRTPAGRVHRTEPDKVYRLVNYLIQGCAADLLKRKIVDLDNAGLTYGFVLPVHDEFIFDVPAEDVDDFVHEAEPIISELRDFKVPLTAGAEVVAVWGDKYR